MFVNHVNWARFGWDNAGKCCAIIQKQVDKYMREYDLDIADNDTYYDNEEYD